LEKNDALVSFVLQLYSFKKYITDTFWLTPYNRTA
jgi:hypothetical protein